MAEDVPIDEKPKDGLPEKHVSVAALGRFRRCGYQDYLYLTEGPRAPGVAQLRGTAVHDVACLSLREKRDAGAAWTAERAKDEAAKQFSGLIQAKGVRLTDEEFAEGEAKVLGQAKDFAVRAAEIHAEKVVPGIQPELVEAEIVSPEPVVNDHYLVGRLDVTDTSRRVRDLKTTTTKAMVNQRVADTSPQLTVYAFLYQMSHGVLPDRVVLDGVIVGDVRKDGTRNTEYVPTVSDRDMVQIHALLKTMQVLVRAREAGVYMPVDPSGPSGWVCTPKWCGYTSICPFYRRGRIAP